MVSGPDWQLVGAPDGGPSPPGDDSLSVGDPAPRDELPEVRCRTSVGIRLALVEPRILAAVFFGMGFVPGTLREEARQVTMPLQLLLQWDDEGMERQPVLDLFDAFGAEEKTLHANLGGHAGTPWFEVDDAARFFARHLK